MDVSLARILLFSTYSVESRNFPEESTQLNIQVLVYCHPRFRVGSPNIYQCGPCQQKKNVPLSLDYFFLNFLKNIPLNLMRSDKTL